LYGVLAFVKRAEVKIMAANEIAFVASKH
jgi:hypothetical protein